MELVDATDLWEWMAWKPSDPSELLHQDLIGAWLQGDLISWDLDFAETGTQTPWVPSFLDFERDRGQFRVLACHPATTGPRNLDSLVGLSPIDQGTKTHRWRGTDST